MMAGKMASDRNNDSVLEVFTIPHCAGCVLAWSKLEFRGPGYFNFIEMLVFYFKREFYD